MLLTLSLQMSVFIILKDTKHICLHHLMPQICQREGHVLCRDKNNILLSLVWISHNFSRGLRKTASALGKQTFKQPEEEKPRYKGLRSGVTATSQLLSHGWKVAMVFRWALPPRLCFVCVCGGGQGVRRGGTGRRDATPKPKRIYSGVRTSLRNLDISILTLSNN